jgi:hypothetical protein
LSIAKGSTMTSFAWIQWCRAWTMARFPLVLVFVVITRWSKIYL